MKYYEVKFNIQPYSDDAADIVAAIAGEAGFESFDTADGTLTGYVQQPLFDEPLLRQLLDTCPLPDVSVAYTVGEAEDRDWNEQWEQEGFEPIFVEERGARSEERGILIHDGRHLPTDYSPSSFFAEQSGRAERLVPPSSLLVFRLSMPSPRDGLLLFTPASRYKDKPPLPAPPAATSRNGRAYHHGPARCFRCPSRRVCA